MKNQERLNWTILGMTIGICIAIVMVAHKGYADDYVELETEFEALFTGEEVLQPGWEPATTEKAPDPFTDSKIERELDDGTLQKFDGNRYMIVRRGAKKKKPGVKESKVKQFKNRVSLIGSYGSLGNIKEENNTARTEQGLVLGIQLMRDIKTEEDYSLHILIQGQTNKTFSGGFGIGF